MYCYLSLPCKLQIHVLPTGRMGGVNLSINKMEFSLAISQLLLVQLGKFVDTIIFEIVEHYCMFITLVRLGKQRKVDFSTVDALHFRF